MLRCLVGEKEAKRSRFALPIVFGDLILLSRGRLDSFCGLVDGRAPRRSIQGWVKIHLSTTLLLIAQRELVQPGHL